MIFQSFYEAQGRRRQRRWQERRREGEAGVLAGGGVARGIAGSGAHRWRRRGAEEARARCRESRGRSGSAGSNGWPGRGGRARGVGWLDARGSVGRLDRSVQVMDLCSITLGNE
jgi:hypothetical protein